MRSTTATVASLVRKRSSASTRSVASWITPRSSTTPTTLPKNGRSPRPPANTATPAATASIPMVAIARIVNARRMGCRRAMPSGPAAPPATGGLGGCPGNHGGCGERSGGARREPRCQMAARSSLLRRAFRHGSSVVAALAALAPRLVRLAHHGYSDSLLVPERVTREGQEHVLEGGAPPREVEAVERAEDARPGLAVAEIEVEDLADALGPPRPGAQARDGARVFGLGPREVDLDDVRAHVGGDQLRRRTLGDDAAVVHDDGAVAELRGLLHVVRGEEDGRALALERADALPDQPPRLRIEAGGRLAEDEEARLVEQG